MTQLSKIINTPLTKLEPVYLVYGEDKYLLRSFKQKFVSRFIDDKLKDFNYSFLDEDENFAATLKNQVNTPPFMADKRFIIAKTRDYFVKKQEDDRLLVNLFENFPSSTVLLIIVEGKINKKLKAVKSIKKAGKILEAKAPRYRELDQWISNKFAEKGKKIDGRGIKILEKMFNNDLDFLANEIEKISLYNIDKKVIKVNDIKEIISKDRLLEENSIFSLTDALIKKKKGLALKLLNEMIGKGIKPLSLLGTILWQIRLFYSVKTLKKEGNNVQEISKKLNVHEYPVKKCYQQASNYSEKELELLLEKLLLANLNIVQGKYEGKMALEMAILA